MRLLFYIGTFIAYCIQLYILIICYISFSISPVWQPGRVMKAANRSLDEPVSDPNKKSADMPAEREDLNLRQFPREHLLDSIPTWKGIRMKRTALLLVCLTVGLIHPGSISSGPVNPVSGWVERAGSMTYVSGDHRAKQDRGLPEGDSVPEPGTLLLFGTGLIALTLQLKFKTFNRR